MADMEADTEADMVAAMEDMGAGDAATDTRDRTVDGGN